MCRLIGAMVLGTVACSAAMAVQADNQKTRIQGGIEGKIKSVDVDGKTITITTPGRERSFAITDETEMIGPRGGKVRLRLRDPRFHEGLAVTIVASGNTASEIHLGYDRPSSRDSDKSDKSDTTAEPTRRPTKAAPRQTDETPRTEASPRPRTRILQEKAAEKKQEADEDTEFPGKIKSYDATRRMLVITMRNGTDRSFLLSKNVPVMVRGADSRRGLEDPALRPGATVEIVTEEGGRKVKEVKVLPGAEIRRRRAG